MKALALARTLTLASTLTLTLTLGWIHSKKRNRLGQKNVERLVRAHTNLTLCRNLDDFAAKALPWEIEMIIEEPELEAEVESEVGAIQI